jgi:WhiB family redox-sensing transcriptional regulator
MSRSQTGHQVMPGAPRWHQRAACGGTAESVFFSGDEREETAARRIRESKAKKLCFGCPVIELCREHALSAPEVFGVWGGLGEAERWKLLAPRRRRSSRLSLSKGQWTVLVVAAEGGTYAEVAKKCGISRDAVRTRIRAAGAKLGAESRDETVAAAQRLGLIPRPRTQQSYQLQEV